MPTARATSMTVSRTGSTDMIRITAMLTSAGPERLGIRGRPDDGHHPRRLSSRSARTGDELHR